MDIDVTAEGKKVTINLHRGHGNALNHNFLKEILSCIEEIEKRTDIAIVVIRSGIPHIVSSGLDLGELFVVGEPSISRQNVIEAVRLTYEINKKIIESKHIYYFVGNAMVIGAAVSIMLACDFRVASEKSWIWLPDVQYGGLLADGGLELLRYRGTSSIANKIAISNNRLNAVQLKEAGIFDWVSKPEQLENSVNRDLERMEKLSLLSMSLTKKILNRDLSITFHEELLEKIFDSEDVYLMMSQYISR